MKTRIKTSREEELTRRLCEYLGLTCRCSTDQCVSIAPRYHEPAAAYMVGWENALFGAKPDKFGCRNYLGLCELPKWPCATGDWKKAVSRMNFKAESLDELELQLSIRGF